MPLERLEPLGRTQLLAEDEVYLAHHGYVTIDIPFARRVGIDVNGRGAVLLIDRDKRQIGIRAPRTGDRARWRFTKFCNRRGRLSVQSALSALGIETLAERKRVAGRYVADVQQGIILLSLPKAPSKATTE